MHYLGTWRVFAWELGEFSFGNLASFRLGTWRVFVWEDGCSTKNISDCKRKIHENDLCISRKSRTFAE